MSLRASSSSGEIQKIDSAPTDGLLGVEDSLAYRVHEIERHLHSYGHWFGLAAVPVGETHRADHMTVTPFVSTAGNNAFGPWLQILGSSDTPHITGMTHFDLNTLLISDVAAPASLTLHLIQIGYGASGAAALAADAISEIMSIPEQNGRAAPIPFRARRQDVETKVWLRHWVDGVNAPTMDFFIALHEYEG